jgi:hypothetical protein
MEVPDLKRFERAILELPLQTKEVRPFGKNLLNEWEIEPAGADDVSLKLLRLSERKIKYLPPAV